MDGVSSTESLGAKGSETPALSSQKHRFALIFTQQRNQSLNQEFLKLLALRLSIALDRSGFWLFGSGFLVLQFQSAL